MIDRFHVINFPVKIYYSFYSIKSILWKRKRMILNRSVLEIMSRGFLFFIY